jgi:hypothetical protein
MSYEYRNPGIVLWYQNLHHTFLQLIITLLETESEGLLNVICYCWLMAFAATPVIS